MKGHIRKRGSGWQVVVYLGRDEQGKKKYKYQTVNGTKKEAQRIMTELLHQLNTNTFVDPGRVTFGEYLERWLQDYCVPKLAPKTFKRYEEIIKLHLIPELGNIQLAKLQPLNLQQYYTMALASGRKGLKHKENKGLSPTTVLFHHRVIHKALEQAVKWQLVGRNVADAVEPPRKADTEFETIDNDTLLNILKVIKEKNPVIYVPVLLAGATGMRRGEVLGLRWSDLNFKTRRLSVKQQLQRIDKELTLAPTKSEKSKRTITLPEFLIDVLRQHKVEQNKQRLVFGQAYSNNLMFTWEDGRPIDPDYLTKRFIKISKSLGLNIRLHDLRHSYATFLLSKNVHPKVVSELLGHSSIGITLDTYSHVTPSMQEEVASMVGNEFEKARLSKDCQTTK